MAWYENPKVIGLGLAGVLGAVLLYGAGASAGARDAAQPPPAGTDRRQDPATLRAALSNPRSLNAAQRGSVVRTTQYQLRELGYGHLAIDGIAGPQTNAAIHAFMADHPGSGADDVAVTRAIDAAFAQRFGA